MFDGYNWTTEVIPVMQGFLNSSLLHGAIEFVIAVSLVGIATRQVISVFHRRD